MVETKLNTIPSLIVVSGRPGSGKSTLAHRLARAIRCPVISRDEIKEGIVNTGGDDAWLRGDEVKWRVYEAFFETVTLLLNRGVTVVAEAAFQHAVWAPKLEPLLNIARTKVIVCVVDPELARSRHVQRGLADPDRERFHADPAVAAAREGRQLPIGSYKPPQFDVPTLAVDTSDGCKPTFEEIVAFARGSTAVKTVTG